MGVLKHPEHPEHPPGYAPGLIVPIHRLSIVQCVSRQLCLVRGSHDLPEQVLGCLEFVVHVQGLSSVLFMFFFM